MLIHESTVDLEGGSPDNVMRVHEFRPLAVTPESGCKIGALIVFSEIYQVTGPVERFCRMLADAGFIVCAPEVWHEYEAIGTCLVYNAEDTDKGIRLKGTKPAHAHDADARAVVDYLMSHPNCNGRIGATGMCLGGHLAFRAALLPEVKSAACLYATDLHTFSLGSGDDTLLRAQELEDSEMVLIWGRQDNHVDLPGRTKIKQTLENSGVDFTWHEFNGAHAFIRDELSKGRYDPSLARIVHMLILELFNRTLTLGLPSMSKLKPQS